MVSRLIYDGNITIISNFPDANEWIHAHLPEDAEVSPFGTGWSGQIAIDSSSNRYAELLTLADSARIRSYPRLYENESYERVDLDGESLFLMRPGAAESLPHAILGSFDTSWRIVVPDGSTSARRQTLRSLRSILRGFHLEHGGLLMHGATAGGALFLGPSGAGKTSAAIRFARNSSVPLVSTDRTLLRPDPAGNGIIAIGGPEVMRLGVGLVNEVDHSLMAKGSSTRLHQDLDRVRTSGTAYGSKNKLELTFDDAKNVLGIRSQDCVKLKAIVLPQPAESRGELLRVDESGLDDAAEHLLHPDTKHGYPLAPNMLANDAARTRVRQLLSKLPVYRLIWPLHDDNHRSALFEDLGAALLT